VPVGGLYISTNSINPSTMWKNTTWEQYAPGRVLVGANTSDDNFKTLGQTGGTKTETLNLTQIPSHNHTCDSQGNHIHYVNANGNHNHIVDNHSHYVPPHQHVTPWGEHAGVYNPPWGRWDAGGRQIGSHDSDYDNIWGMTSPTDVNTHGSQPGTNVAGWHDHTTNTTGAHAHNIGNTGGGQAHNNMQPYIVVTIWRRLT
jgi:microcystin-dependent protein